jgi:GGDEF domain-containing protein
MNAGTTGDRLTQMSFEQARRLILVAGLVILLLTAAFMFLRRVDTAEVVAVLLFVPIFLAFVYQGVKGGLVAAGVATLIYLAVRYPAMQAIGAGDFIPLIVQRGLAFFIFGAVGGWANEQLAASLTKLEIYDQIDDYTGLFNARFFVQDTDLEISRAKRYQTIFSVAAVDFPVEPLEKLSQRQRKSIRRELGRMLQEAVRAVDRPVHGYEGTRHSFAVVLPETGVEGSRIFTERLAERMAAYLRDRGVPITAEDVRSEHVTYPDDGEGRMQQLRERFAEIDRHEHPQEKTTASATQAPPSGASAG